MTKLFCSHKICFMPKGPNFETADMYLMLEDVNSYRKKLVRMQYTD